MTSEGVHLAACALQAARKGAAHAASGYRKPKALWHKGAVDLVTEFDTAAEHLIREELARLTPDIPVVAEEEGGEPSRQRTWYVDPIDGTTNYAHGHPFWCVSIGLVSSDGLGVGVVVAPSLQAEWVADGSGEPLRNGERCAVSGQAELAESLLATGFPYDRHTSSENNFAAFEHFQRMVQGVRRCGSAALDLCLVADGTYDGYWERKLKPWDLAAGIAIVSAAGGRVTAFDGSPVDLRAGYVVASNGRIHEAMLAQLAQAGS